MKKNYQRTITACFVGYIVQAIINNFVPLLFVMFNESYGIPFNKITLLITFNFILQLLVDLFSVTFVDKIGYRKSMIIAHLMSAAGLVLLIILPDVMSDSFTGLLMAVVVYAIGGGLLEVLVSPVVESCPSDNKEKTMSLLHSFYCWGHVGVVLISTAFFTVFGIKNWKLLALIWALIPTANAFAFARVPMAPLLEDGEKGMSMRELFETRVFWVLLIMMLCAGASEQAVSQWASTLAEKGLGISKSLGDIAGPMSFALMMGAARAFYGKKGDGIDLEKFMLASSILCIFSYLLIALVPIPALGLAGCALCGLSVGIMWPGTFSIAAAALRRGGTAMFALLALAGDMGCTSGPTLAGWAADLFNDDLRKGILAAIIFPMLLIAALFARHSMQGRE